MLKEHSLLYRLKKTSTILFSILLSGRTEAYYALLLKLIKILLSPVDLLFYLLERIFIKTSNENDFPIIFIVGIQRTGSTFVSQVMERAYPFYPLGNFASILPHSGYIAHKLIQPFFKQKAPDQSYRNYYGISKGLFSVGDCYDVWDRWFGSNHYSVPTVLSTKKTKSIRRYFNLLQKAYQEPILTKNNRNGNCVELLHQIFPNAYFVVVERNPVDVIKSTIKASHDFFGRKSQILWGSKPFEHFDVKNYSNFTEAATVQYAELDKLLHHDLKSIPHNKYTLIRYEAFCEDPNSYVDEVFESIRKEFKLSIQKKKVKFRGFKKSNRLSDTSLKQEIQNYLSKVNNKDNE